VAVHKPSKMHIISKTSRAELVQDDMILKFRAIHLDVDESKSTEFWPKEFWPPLSTNLDPLNYY
ncbi:Hypothetical protein FKW44_009980, partial [Caligus rogercresseyi]